MSFFQSIPELNELSKGIAFAQMWKIAVCWKFQLIFQKNNKKEQIQNFSWLEPLKVAPEVTVGGSTYLLPRWVEHAQKNPGFLKKIE